MFNAILTVDDTERKRIPYFFFLQMSIYFLRLLKYVTVTNHFTHFESKVEKCPPRDAISALTHVHSLFASREPEILLSILMA